MIIAATGTPGTGKTTLAKKIAKLGFGYIDGKKIGEEIAERYDEKMQTYIVDEKLFARKIVRIIKGKETRAEKKADYEKLKRLLKKDVRINKKTEDMVIDSHLSHYIPKKHIDLVIVTRCDISELRRRLAKRRYPAEKIKENIEAEIFDTCGVEARRKKHRIIEFWTSKSP